MNRVSLLSTAGALFVGLLAFALSPACLRWLHGLLAARTPPLPKDAIADVAIVLGYALCRNGSLTEPLKGRVQAGVDAFLQGRARHLLFSGSHPGGVVVRRTEANVMREYAEQLMPAGEAAGWAERWLEEDASTSTYENALFSLAICKEKGWKTLLIVTSPFHQLRSELVFRRLVSEATKAAAGLAGQEAASAGGAGLARKDEHLAMEVFMARAAMVPHAGYFSPLANRLVDLWDWIRELLALVYYYTKGRL
ncbi:hypothetical protein VOLCADRAFT_106645 [Volvox carteri f. nagariensis]|uniref:DUF218 domain-containing protein n=1 Tax=Volvox carteri f. nagariensis TaxID=3068 RepID=D8U8V6_VOLCA|nr:uncharacterized protein VOLCADRAFT_106645 [Volvox carteri f. nagariensis]EFJ43873.1 hypothetical protein VOLCADRAFT_106645 [Volvox carteri f. nagariensis]|eukprot:XP_002955119.1 hypothetical protein VOLCADRAFT_106645 [Volvox carteri f. nagariensis]